jgi:stage V sporulation protein R
MELIDQHTKKIMEGCKARARDEGLSFHEETLEYIVTNRDLLELSGKLMIPTLYDYWVHDVEVIREKGRYELYPGNPYETVINTRPAISFYNDNNPDWLNVMIFYHVLAHVDFFQNNLYFQRTWNDDFTGQALSDKRLITKLRSEKGRWVDYIIEFTRGIDNLVGYHVELAESAPRNGSKNAKKVDFYFDLFLQSIKKASSNEYFKEIERYNRCNKDDPGMGEEVFLSDIDRKYPEFTALYDKHLKARPRRPKDHIEFIMEHSEFLNRDENRWMKSVMQVVRNTALFFSPQIRTKIMNEGWASYWHEKLFFKDSRIEGHEVDFARVHAGVTALPRVGLNPYALGMRLFEHIEAGGDRGRYSFEFSRLQDAQARTRYDAKTAQGKELIFSVRENMCDFILINTFVDQEFITKNKLFVTGKRLNSEKSEWEYFVKSREAGQYRQMVLDTLYHPPHIEIDAEKAKKGTLYLMHRFEGRPLVKEYIHNTMLGIEFLWGGPVQLETQERVSASKPPLGFTPPSGVRTETDEAEKNWQRIVYTMEGRKLSRKNV